MEQNKIKALIYWQQSDDIDKEAELKEYCRLNGYNIYEDSNTTINEPKLSSFNHIVSTLNDKVFDVVVVYSIYDLANDSTELLRYLNEIHEAPNIHFIALKENINSRYYDSKEMLRLANILLTFKHKRHSEKTKMRMRRAVALAKEEGRQLAVRGKDKVKRKTDGYQIQTKPSSYMSR